LVQLGGDEAALLLRLKAKFGDRRPLIVGHVFDSLINLEAELGVAFVAEYLDAAHPEIRDEAALALGASRRSDAVEILIERWKGTRSSEFGSVLLRALSSSRTQAAIDFLLDLLRTGTQRDSAAALDALALIEPSEELQGQIEAARQQQDRNLAL
jgi:hypothetical protein